jgi:hypothetical protein
MEGKIWNGIRFAYEESDSDLARAVLCAWLDFARDKGVV